MKTYSMSFAAACSHTPQFPERTAKRSGRGLNFDVIFKVWPARGPMARSIRMQQKRETRSDDWRPCVALKDCEGY